MKRRAHGLLLPITLLPLLLPLVHAARAEADAPRPKASPKPRLSALERAEARRQHWETQRTFPTGRIPDGAYAKASAALRELPVARPAGPGRSALASFIAPNPEDAPWTFLGPAPLDTTTGDTPNWSPSAGRASAVAVDPTNSSVIYVGYSLGGVWKSVDDGKTFVPLMDDQPTLAVGAIAIDPAKPSTIYVGTGEPALYAGYVGRGLFQSIDAGKTWNKIGGDAFDGLIISRLLLDGPDMYLTTVFGNAGKGDYCTATDYEAPGQGLYKSTDGGKTFQKIKDGSLVDLEIDVSSAPHRLFISDLRDGVLYSTNGGGQWLSPQGLPTPKGMPRASRIEVSFSVSDPSIVYAGMGLDDAAALFISVDQGASFTQVASAPNYCGAQCYYDNAILTDPTDPGTVYLGGAICAIWKGTGVNTAQPTWTSVSSLGKDCGVDGANWYLSYVHPDVHALAVDPKSASIVYAATDGGVARTKDSGDTWERINDGVGTIQFYSVCADPLDPKVAYGGAQDNGTMRTDGSSLTWTAVIGGDGGPCVINPNNTKNIIASVEQGTLFRTLNGFASPPSSPVFDASPYCQGSEPGCGDRVGFIAPFVGGSTGGFYMGTHRLWQSAATGSPITWKPISPDLTLGAAGVPCLAGAFGKGDDVLTAIAVAPSAATTIYTGSVGGLVSATTDGGMKWSSVSKAPLPGRYTSAIAVDPLDDKMVYVAFSGFSENTPSAPGHVFASIDGGQTWTPRDTPVDIPVNSLTAHPVARGLLYAGTDVGVLVSTDAGQTWRTLGDALPNVPVNEVVFQRPGTRLIAATYGRSAFAMTFTPGAPTPAPASLSFTVEQGKPDPDAQTVDVTDADIYGSILDFAIASDSPWLAVTPDAGRASGENKVTVTAMVKAADLAPGDYDGNIVLTPEGGGAAVNVPVHFAITKPPAPPAPPRPKEDDSGCGCRLGAEPPALPGALFVGLAGLALARYRRRTSA